jgi:hypothetical protein
MLQWRRCVAKRHENTLQVHGKNLCKENAKKVMGNLCPLMNVLSKDKSHKIEEIDANNERSKGDYNDNNNDQENIIVAISTNT